MADDIGKTGAVCRTSNDGAGADAQSGPPIRGNMGGMGAPEEQILPPDTNFTGNAASLQKDDTGTGSTSNDNELPVVCLVHSSETPLCGILRLVRNE